MKIAFLTEMGFTGKIPKEHPNMRTEFAWMHALDADHYNIHSPIEGYDVVFVIFPDDVVAFLLLPELSGRVVPDQSSAK